MSVGIATQNVWGRAPLWTLRKRALARGLRGADIVVLQEVQARGTSSQAHELADEMALPHAAFASAGRTLWWREGVGVISRWPLTHIVWEKLAPSRHNPVDRLAPRVVLRVVVDTPVGKLEVYALHLSLSKAARTRTAAAIAAFAQRQRQAVPADGSFFGGDFNASSQEPCLREIQSTCGVRDVHEGGGATFPALWPHRRLDYLLLSPNLRVTGLERRGSIGSDHCGVLAHVERLDQLHAGVIP